jgi:hypothetical protein
MDSEKRAIDDAKPKALVLNSWKEIAQYVGRAVRTVQRWESLGLPARRLRGKSRSAVLAMTDELDAWLRASPARRVKSLPPSHARAETRNLLSTNAELCEQCRRLRSDYSQMLDKLNATLQALADATQRKPRAKDGHAGDGVQPGKLTGENRVLRFENARRPPPPQNGGPKTPYSLDTIMNPDAGGDHFALPRPAEPWGRRNGRGL